MVLDSKLVLMTGSSKRLSKLRLKEKIEKGTDTSCITGNIIKDPEVKLNFEELKSICLTMVSAGFDTVPANIIQGIGYLFSSHRQVIQQKAYDEIMKVYSDGDAWEKCLTEERVDYITALVKEILRYYSVIPMCLPRRSVKDISYQQAIIPAGTFFYMNAYAANYDETYFNDPHTFIPERYLKEKESSIVGTPHYSFGAGSRMCIGAYLANRELYTVFIRLIHPLRYIHQRIRKKKQF